MAEMLKRLHDLAVIKVTLLPAPLTKESIALRGELPTSSESNAHVRFEFEQSSALAERNPTCEIDARDMGIPRNLDPDRIRGRGKYGFRLSQALVDWLKEIAQTKLSKDSVVWLHLVAPYGYLGMFPWENLLTDCFPNAVLRLPNFVVEAPQQTPTIIDVALCCKQGVADADSDTANLVVSTARAMASMRERRQMRIYVFADRPICALLERLTEENSITRIYPVDPDGPGSSLANYISNAVSNLANPIRDWLRQFRSRPAIPSSSELLANSVDPLSSPWLRSVRKMLGLQSVDVIHILAHSTLSLERGALLLDQTDPNADSPHLLLPSEFLAFQAQTGAWAVGLSSPSKNYCDMGMRQFADGLAQSRPGPLLYHDISADPDCSSLTAAYQFLLSEKPSMPLLSSATFAYCEPFRVREADDTGKTIDDLSRRSVWATQFPENPGVKAAFQNASVPGWVAASERFVDMYKLRLAEMTAKPSAGSDERAEEIRATLQRIQAAVVKIADPGNKT